MKRIFSLMLLCAAVIFAGCSKDDEPAPNPNPAPVTGVTLDKTTLSLEIGKTATLVATIAPKDAAVTVVTWSSDKPAVAAVSDKGVVTAIAEGTATITVKTEDGGKTATCVVTVEDKSKYVEVNGIKMAVGNLVADGANGAKIGTATDGGLFFQFGSLVGWSTTDPLVVAVSPIGYAGSTTWNKDWTGDPATENVATGTGDPCKYYLKDTWRLPTRDEYVALFKDGGYPNGTWKWENSSATNTTLGLTFRASGYRDYYDGNLPNVGTIGFYWCTPGNVSFAYNLTFDGSDVYPSSSSFRAFGFPVRCVK